MADFLFQLAALVAVYAVLAAALNLALGFGGILNLGHTAFFALGAYTSALLALGGMPWGFAATFGGLAAAAAGWGLASATGRLQGDYLALATLAFQYVIHTLINNLEPVTRGPVGIAGVPRPEGLESPAAFAVLTLVWAGLVFFALRRLTASPWGRLLAAVREDAQLVRSLGRRPEAVKTTALMLSAFFTGTAGAFYAAYLGFINPATFGTEEVVLGLTLVMAGGVASLGGSAVAAAVLLLLPEALRFLPLPADARGALQQMLWCSALLLLLLFRPRGLFGRIDLPRNL